MKDYRVSSESGARCELCGTAIEPGRQYVYRYIPDFSGRPSFIGARLCDRCAGSRPGSACDPIIDGFKPPEDPFRLK